MDELKNRKTTRLKGADYNRNQAVFLTICTKERRCVLSRIVGTGVLDGPQIELTKYGQIADKYIRPTENIARNRESRELTEYAMSCMRQMKLATDRLEEKIL